MLIHLDSEHTKFFLVSSSSEHRPLYSAFNALRFDAEATNFLDVFHLVAKRFHFANCKPDFKCLYAIVLCLDFVPPVALIFMLFTGFRVLMPGNANFF